MEIYLFCSLHRNEILSREQLKPICVRGAIEGGECLCGGGESKYEEHNHFSTMLTRRWKSNFLADGNHFEKRQTVSITKGIHAILQPRRGVLN
ncbi:hypothetical protein CEXT_397231 [Caerostris extrusa]|uniref:Uncharacterized protein n=1 Tax=Caerostris extrusa TaxID=172846 RepID=A0AAV4PMR8_CAEEX|nr:hypothetical protein CEXT_397231 [Caerostris extrusa]